jgi:hypothetical protein
VLSFIRTFLEFKESESQELGIKPSANYEFICLSRRITRFTSICFDLKTRNLVLSFLNHKLSLETYLLLTSSILIQRLGTWY